MIFSGPFLVALVIILLAVVAMSCYPLLEKPRAKVRAVMESVPPSIPPPPPERRAPTSKVDTVPMFGLKKVSSAREEDDTLIFRDGGHTSGPSDVEEGPFGTAADMDAYLDETFRSIFGETGTSSSSVGVQLTLEDTRVDHSNQIRA